MASKVRRIVSAGTIRQRMFRGQIGSLFPISINWCIEVSTDRQVKISVGVSPIIICRMQLGRYRLVLDRLILFIEVPPSLELRLWLLLRRLLLLGRVAVEPVDVVLEPRAVDQAFAAVRTRVVPHGWIGWRLKL